MNVPRIHQKISLALHSKVLLDGDASHHLARVLRAKIGDPIIIFNGEGGEFAGVIVGITKKAVEVELLTFINEERESPLQLTLAQGMARGDKMDLILQKSVELGVQTIVPLMTARTTLNLHGDRLQKRIDHWQRVIISACEQCGRNRVPHLAAPKSYHEWLKEVQAPNRFVLSPHAKQDLTAAKVVGETVLLIGPEGGLSEGEIADALKHAFQPLQLGPRILRTETAPLVALTIFQALFGDLISADFLPHASH